VIVIGAGIGGLACAIDLAAHGAEVLVLEAAATAGGKMREARPGGIAVDAGPTVFTMRWVFESLFADAGASFADAVRLDPLQILARHAWSATERLDLFADPARSADAIAAFAGAAEGRGFLAFAAEARSMFQTLRDTYLTAPRPSTLSLAKRIGLSRPGDLLAIRPFETLWSALSKHFQDPRLRQLFGRYATYSGSSPFLAPATLMLIAHVEQEGVWTVAGGMQRLAEALQGLAAARGASFRFGAPVREIIVSRDGAAGVILASGERLEAGAVVMNGDCAALAEGGLGRAARGATPPVAPAARALSAVTWARVARSDGFPLLRHNVFFSTDYAAEFDALFGQRRLPVAPTVYLCAQDRGGEDNGAPLGVLGPERLLMLVNAPPTGDTHVFTAPEIAACETSAMRLLNRCGLTLTGAPETVISTPADFNRLFPHSGGALYGAATHGAMASFRRPAAQTAIPRLYLAGGTTHPGAGVPMAALSGRLAARRLLADRASTRRSPLAAIFGGISTPKATTSASR
jgi:1-hydroxycarotenoid 3,4-desaturase